MTEFFKYFDEHGFICPVPQPPGAHCSNGNGHLDTAIFLILLIKITGHKDSVSHHWFCKYLETLKSCEISTGLYLRGPHKPNDQISRDDYFGIMTLSHMFGLIPASMILSRGIEYLYDYDTEDENSFSFKAWFARYPDFVAHAYYCCSLRPGWIAQLGYYLSALRASKTSDSIVMQWLKYLACPKKTGLERKSCLLFLKRLRALGGLKNIMVARYGAEHPITMVSPKWGMRHE